MKDVIDVVIYILAHMTDDLPRRRFQHKGTNVVLRASVNFAFEGDLWSVMPIQVIAQHQHYYFTMALVPNSGKFMLPTSNTWPEFKYDRPAVAALKRALSCYVKRVQA